MARGGVGSNVLISRSPATSSNFGSPNGSGPDLDGMAHNSYDAQFKEVRDILLPIVQGFKDLDKHSRPFVRPWYCHLQNYWCRTNRQCPLCQFGFICRDGAKCQRPFTERLLQFPCEQFHAGVSTWFDKFLATADIPAANKPIKIHCKTGSRSARLVFETRAKCREFVVHFKDDGVQCLYFGAPIKITRWSWNWKTICATLECLVQNKKLQELFPESDIEGTFIVPSLDVRAQVLNIHDRRNGDGKHVFKLAPPGHDQMFAITAPRVCEPHISDDELRQVMCQASSLAQNRTANVWWPPVASSPFRRLASRGPFFFCGVTLWCFFLNCCLSVQMYGPSWPRKGKSSCFVPSSIRHYVLLFPFCPTAW